MAKIKTCMRCHVEINQIGVVWWQDVKSRPPNFDWSAGDLCDKCHDEWLREGIDGKSEDIKSVTYWEQSRKRFESFAAMDAPELPPDPVDALQVQLCRWQVSKFGTQTSELMALGVTEECGELMDATDSVDIFDAVGDVCIYTSQLFTINRMAISIAFEAIDVMDDSKHMLVAVGKLAHVVLKRENKIRGMDDRASFRRELFNSSVDVLDSIVQISGLTSPEKVMASVAENVMTRTGEMLPQKK